MPPVDAAHDGKWGGAEGAKRRQQPEPAHAHCPYDGVGGDSTSPRAWLYVLVPK